MKIMFPPIPSHLLIRCGEIFLKGKNYPTFERKIIENIKKLTPLTKITCLRGRFIAPYFENHKLLRRVFGLISYSPAWRINKTMNDLQEAVLALLQGKSGTFKLEPKRSDKSFPLTSPEINIQLGKFIETHTTLRFDGYNYGHRVGIEINQDGIYLYLETVSCFGGLPTGVEGKALLLVETENSLLAGLLLMKRGVDLLPVSCSPQDIVLLQIFSPLRLNLVVLGSKEEIKNYALQKNCAVVVTGNLFGEKTSFFPTLTMLKPLVAYSPAEIKEQLVRFKES